MDTRSSSGSGSHSTNLTGARPHATLQQATYTTAGTVYNPQTAPPLQPPARRGRAARWPPAVPVDLAAFNSSVSGGFSRSRYRSPPTTASTLRHYTPLQQNQDRAVNPTQRAPSSLSTPRQPTSGDSSTMPFQKAPPHQLPSDNVPNTTHIVCAECQEIFQNLESAHFHIMISGHESHAGPGPCTDADDEDNGTDGELLQTDDEKEEEDLAQFNNYSVKTLTNLASYPNPNQKMAQKCLDRARKTYKLTPAVSRPISRTSSRPGFDGAGVSASSGLGGGGGRDNSTYYSRVPRNLHMTSSTRSSVLSNGPGAPQPLTAGPPGQRQYKASTLEGPLRALQESAQNPFSSDVSESRFSTPIPFPPAMPFRGGRQAATNIPEHSRAVQQEMESLPPQNASASPSPAEQTALWAARHAHGLTIQPPTVKKSPWTRDIRETRTQDEISGYYQGGQVWDYNALGFISTAKEDNSDLQPPRRCLSVTTDASKTTDMNRHRMTFYAAKDNILKPFEARYNEIHEETRARELGLIHPSEGGPLTVAQMDAAVNSSLLGKERPISIDIINNRMKKCDAGSQLLGMACNAMYEGNKRVKVNSKPPVTATWPAHEWGYVGQERDTRLAAQASRALPQSMAPLNRSLSRDDHIW